MVALDMDGKVRRPQFELDSEQVRYEHRFAPFNSVVTPPPVHYIQFKVLEETFSRTLDILISLFCFFFFFGAKLQFLYPDAILPALSRRCLI